MTEETWTQAPTKTYRGFFVPEGDGTGPVNGVRVTVDDGGGPRRLYSSQFLDSAREDVVFAWGLKGRTVGENELARAILDDALGSAEEAEKYYQRFKHRTVALWSAGSPWSMTLRDVMATVNAIKEVEAANVQARAIVASQVAPVVSEAGGFPGAPILRSPKDQGPGPIVEQPTDPATKKTREQALAKLTDEERRALGL